MESNQKKTDSPRDAKTSNPIASASASQNTEENPAESDSTKTNPLVEKKNTDSPSTPKEVAEKSLKSDSVKSDSPSDKMVVHSSSTSQKITEKPMKSDSMKVDSPSDKDGNHSHSTSQAAENPRKLDSMKVDSPSDKDDNHSPTTSQKAAGNPVTTDPEKVNSHLNEKTSDTAASFKEKQKKSDSANAENPASQKTSKPVNNPSPENRDEDDNEIDDENAEDAEDTDNERRHSIPTSDYESMSMENLVGELQKLVRNEKVQAIKKHVDGIKYEFDQKFDAFLEGKKEKFIESGGSEIDFKYNSNTKRQFNEVYKDYREKREQYYKNREKNLKDNLSERLAIIEELKGLTSIEEDMGSTYKTFKNLQEKWHSAGPIPRDSYNNTWRNYRHHVEIFYDFLHLNREMRDLDFKHNLEEKEKLVQRAEALANEPDINRTFRELQALHKIWKEEIGPVGQEKREEIWERFSKATKVLHQKRQQHFQDLEKTYEQHLKDKRKIIDSIAQLADNLADNHRALQKQMKKLEELRTAFFAAGKVPRSQNKKNWTAFKDAVRSFNRKKNAFYKNLKQDQQENLDKKRELLQSAMTLKDSEDFEAATPEMKRIQAEWKTIGHVPRKYSDKIWKEFKKTCNFYFDRLHALNNKGRQEEEENFEKKTSYLSKLTAVKPSGNRETDLKTVKSYIDIWKTLGRVPFKKKKIDQKFNKTLDALLRKMDIGRKEAELLKYGNKIERLADSENERAIGNERSFIRKKIEEIKGEIRQLETNLQFFSNASEDNPMVRDVIKKVNTHKESLAVWEAKLKKLNIMENRLNREAEDENLEPEVEKPEAEEQDSRN
ncbi:MAG: DUF349 domain-containing protein [Pricia sp.]